MTAKTLTFDDIVREMVKKEVGKVGVGGEADFMKMLGIKDLGDITKFISQLSNLSQVVQNQKGGGSQRRLPREPENEPSQPVSQPPANPRMSIKPEAVFDGLVSVMDTLQTLLGDVKMSEAKAFLVERKNEVLPVIAAQIEAIT